MPDPVPLTSNLHNRLTRFLHTGNEIPKYFPGCWSSHKYFEITKGIVLDEIITSGVDKAAVINIILKTYKDGFYTRFDTIAFALCKCLKLGTAAVKTETYRAAIEICNTPEELFLFNKYVRIFRTGNGQGWCNSVKFWYTSKDPMELAKEMTRVRSRHGRSHKTLLRKSHFKLPENDHARDAVVKYAIFGLKYAKQLKGDAPGTKEIFDYIQKVEDLRHCEDPVAAAALASQYHFNLDHVPGHLLTAQAVWDAILPQLSLKDLLYNIQRIHNMGFLTNESTTTAALVSLLSNKDVIKNSKITPLEVYITLCNYKKKCRPMKHEKAKIALEKEARRRTRQIFDTKTGLWEWTATRRHPKEVKHWGIDQPPNPAVIAALNKLVDQTWLLTPKTGLRYMITLDMRHHMFKGRHFCKTYEVPKKIRKVSTTKSVPGPGGDADTEKKSKKHLLAECFYDKNVTPGHAAIILALQILKREKNVKLAVFTEEGVQIVSIERNFTSIEETEYMLRQANLGRVQLDAPMEWAVANRQPIDVFINMVDRVSRYMELDKGSRGGRGPGGRYGPPPAAPDVPDHCPVRALLRYRDAVKLPHSKLIVMSLASHRIESTDGTHEGVLDIVGIDEHVPRVLDAFALGQFKYSANNFANFSSERTFDEIGRWDEPD